MTRAAITEAIRVLLGAAPEPLVDHAVRRTSEGSTLSGAVTEFLQASKLKAAEAARV